MIKLGDGRIVIHDSSFFTHTPSGFSQVPCHDIRLGVSTSFHLPTSSSSSLSTSSCRGKYEFYGSQVCVVRRGGRKVNSISRRTSKKKTYRSNIYSAPVASLDDAMTTSSRLLNISSFLCDALKLSRS